MSAKKATEVESCLSESGWEREIKADFKKRDRVGKN